MKPQSSHRRPASVFELSFIAVFFVFFFALAFLAPRAGAQEDRNRDVERLAAQTAATVRQEQKPSKSIVRGRAVYDETGRPVRGAPVMLLPANPREGGGEQTGLTNARGEFVIRNVRAGKYFVMVNVPGVITPIGFVDLNEARSETFNLDEIKQHFEEVAVDGINTINVEVRAKRGAAISGRVSYADGDPAINVPIALMRKKGDRTVRTISSITAAMFTGMRTDDRGMYRITGLPPGDYYISASETVMHGDRGEGREMMELTMMGGIAGGESLATTYYKDATSEKEASAIHVEPGQEASEINFTIVERPTYRLRGVVRAKRGGQPFARARIQIARKDATDTFSPLGRQSGSTQSDEQGRFGFNEIPDGAYTLTFEPPYGGDHFEQDFTVSDMNSNGNVVPADVAVVTNNNGNFSSNMSRPPREREPRFVRKQQEVKVAGADQNNIVVELAQGASISGTIVMENGGPLPRIAGVSVQTEAQESPEAGGSGYVAPGSNQFTIESLPAGSFHLNASVISTGESGEQSRGKYYAKSITLNNSDLTRDTIKVQEGQTVTGVRVVLAADAATLNGRVVAPGEEKRTLSNKLVLIVPVEANKRRRRSSHTYERTDAEGSFAAVLPPGEYLIIVLPDGAAGAGVPLNEEAISRRAAGATRVTLAPNERKNLEITRPDEK